MVVAADNSGGGRQRAAVVRSSQSGAAGVGDLRILEVEPLGGGHAADTTPKHKAAPQRES